MEDSDIWKILEGIISLQQPDVLAYSEVNELPSEAAQEALKKFALGQVNEEERSELCKQLRDNPHWVAFLADCVKQQRVA